MSKKILFPFKCLRKSNFLKSRCIAVGGSQGSKKYISGGQLCESRINNGLLIVLIYYQEQSSSTGDSVFLQFCLSVWTPLVFIMTDNLFQETTNSIINNDSLPSRKRTPPLPTPTLQRHAHNMFMTCLRHVHDMFTTCSRHVHDMSGHVHDMFMTCS